MGTERELKERESEREGNVHFMHYFCTHAGLDNKRVMLSYVSESKREREPNLAQNEKV